MAIITLKREKKTNQQIIAHLLNHFGRKVDRRSVQRLWAKYNETGTVAIQKGRGRRPKCSKRSGRIIRRMAIANRFDGLKLLTSKTNQSLIEPVSYQTVKRELKKHALGRFIAKRCPLLTATQRGKRLSWARSHKKWPLCNWSRVCFSDEKVFRTTNNRKGVFVTRSPLEKLRPECISGTVKRGAQVHVWGAITWHGVAQLKRVNGNLTAQEYQRQILHDVEILGENFRKNRQCWYFQQDLAPCHSARSTVRFLQEKRIRILPWAGNSPDLNPIENVWGWVQNRLPRQLPRNKDDLFERIRATWDKVPLAYIRTLFRSMPKRVAAVITAKGGATDY